MAYETHQELPFKNIVSPKIAIRMMRNFSLQIESFD